MASTYIEIGGRRYVDLGGGDTSDGPFVPAMYIIDPVTGLPASLGSAGGGDATATNQATQITAEQAILAALSSIAHDASDSGNPLKIGGKALAALSALTLVASGDRTNAAFDLDGAQIVRNGGAIGDRVSGTASNTDGVSTACIAAQAAGIKVNLTDVTLVNMHATSTIYVEIKDGTTVKWVFPVPALGGVTHRFETPLTGTAATAWNFDPSASTATIYCSMAGRLSKV